MKTLELFPTRVREPRSMGAIEMAAFEQLAKLQYQKWFIPFVDEFLAATGFKQGRILEVACGPGLLIKEIATRLPVEVVGIDISPHALSLARQNTRNLKRVHFHQSSVTHLPFPDDSFDVVLCKDSLHHFDNLDRAIHEMMRVLKPGGYLYMQDMRRDLPYYLIKRSLRRENAIEKLRYYSTRAAYTKREMLAILRRLTGRPVHVRTLRLTKQRAERYRRKGVQSEALKESLQARYNAYLRK